MTNDLLHRIRVKLDQINADPLARRQVPHVRLSENTTVDPDSHTIHGELEIQSDTEGKVGNMLHKLSLEGISSESDFEDFLADVLSRILMNPTNWP